MSLPPLPGMGATTKEENYDKITAWANTVGALALNAIPLRGALGTADLDTILVEGDYHQGVPANATIANNYPQASMMCLVTVRRRENSDSIVQTLRPIGSFTGAGRGTYERIRVAAVWQEWRFTPTQRVDETVGRAIYTYDHVKNREQLDATSNTGWFDIGNAPFINQSSWDPVGKTILLNRTGYNCKLIFRAIVSENPTANAGDLLVLPPGFRGVTDAVPLKPVYVGNSITTASKLIGVRDGALTNGAVSMWDTYGGTTTPLTQGNTVGFTLSWATTNAWPTVAPGPSVGTIPNL